MQFIFETVAATQKTSLAAAADITDSWLVVVERLTQLNLEVSRTAFEQSSEMTLLCLNGCLTEGHTFGWNSGLASGVEHFARYCQAVSAMAQATAQR